MKNDKLKRNSRTETVGLLCKAVVMLIITVAIVAVCLIGYYLVSKIDWSVESKMTTYLNKKYQEEFTVEKPECKGGGFAVKCVWSAHAYPKSNNDLRFDIDCSSTDPSDCSDQYIAALWSIQANGELQEIVSQVNKEFPGYKADNARAEVILSGNLVDNVTKQSNYHSYKTSDSGFLLRLIINSPKSDKKSSYLFSIVGKLREKGIYSVDIDTNKNSGSGVRCEVFFSRRKRGSAENIEKCIIKQE